MSLLVDVAMLVIVFIIFAYAIRHYRFYWNRTFAIQEQSSLDFVDAYTPAVSIVLPMKNEEKVASRLLDALVKIDYPKENGRYEIIAVDDHSTDKTPEIVDNYAARYGFIKAVHRSGGSVLTKPAALNAGLTFVNNEIVLFFDADYVPPRDCVKRLVAPFANPLVVGVMGRVIPINSGETIVTRILDLERAAAYQVDQEARQNLALIPQFGGTVGGFRRAFLSERGHSHFDPYHFAEDTDMTYRAYLSGWRVSYVNTAECYEEVVAKAQQRGVQVRRWAIGHNYCLFDYLLRTATSRFLPFWRKLDGVMLLGVYAMPFLQMVGWILGIYSYLFQPPFWSPLLFALFLTLAYNVVGNLALFSEIGSACYLDRRSRSIWLLPLMLPIVLYYVIVGTRAFIDSIIGHLFVRRKRRKEASESQENTLSSNEKQVRTEWRKTQHSGNSEHS